MCKYKDKYDWFECTQRLTTLLEYNLDYTADGHDRPFSGSQMGRKSKFDLVTSKIEDNYIYRTEDMIINKFVQDAGGKYGRVDETFHYHQHMIKESRFPRKLTVNYSLETTREEEVRTRLMHIQALVFYMEPNFALSMEVWDRMMELIDMGELTYEDFREWVAKTKPEWLPFVYKSLARKFPPKEQWIHLGQKFYKIVFRGGFKHLFARMINRAYRIAFR
jgi:hypothetical protein